MKTFILHCLVGEGLTFEVDAANEQLARVRLAAALAREFQGRGAKDAAAWRAEALDREAWIAINKAQVLRVE